MMKVEPIPLLFAVPAGVGTYLIIMLFYDGVPIWILVGGSGFSGIGLYVVQRGILADQRLRDFQNEGTDWLD